MITPYNIPNSLKGVNGFGRQFSNIKFSVDLVALTEVALVVPNTMSMGTTGSTLNKFLAIIKPLSGTNVWMSVDAVAEVPISNVFVQTTSELIGINGMGLICDAGDSLSFISETASSLSVVFYGIQLT